MSRVIALVQARMGSGRLPGKVMMDIGGRPMIEHVLRRAAAAPGVDEVVLCLSDAPEDEPLIDAVVRAGWGTVPTMWQGAPVTWWRSHGIPATDVVGRLARATMRHPLDTVLVRITGDCPLIDPVIIAAAIRCQRDQGCVVDASEQAGNIDGPDVECFTVADLFNANAAATEPSDREHVTPWMKRNLLTHRLLTRSPGAIPPGAPRKWSVDTQEDLDFVREVYAALGNGLWGHPAVLDYLRRRKKAA